MGYDMRNLRPCRSQISMFSYRDYGYNVKSLHAAGLLSEFAREKKKTLIRLRGCKICFSRDMVHIHAKQQTGVIRRIT